MALKITDVSHLIGVESPWEVSEIEQDVSGRTAKIHVTLTGDAKLRCPKCGKECPGYDHRKRKWRHTNICEYRTQVVARVPRVECPKCGVCTISVPWADARVHYTTQFEACVIDWLYDCQTVSVISDRLGVSWSMIANIMSRGVTRGKARKKQTKVKHICVDETASKKGHNYVTVVSDPLTGTVLYVGSGRKIGSLEGYYDSCSTEQLEALESVSMDMWPAYISATKEHVPEAEKKIAFDRFHVAKYVNEGVDQVRREENRVLKKDGILDLVGTKYDWLKNRINMSAKQKARFDALKNSSLKTARAWAMKDLFQKLYKYKSRTWALKAWKRWLGWLSRSRLEPMKQVGKTIRAHLWGIINAVVLDVSNGPAESLNSRIKTIKIRARGFRNEQRLKDAIYFYLGGLDVYPEGYRNRSTHH